MWRIRKTLLQARAGMLQVEGVKHNIGLALEYGGEELSGQAKLRVISGIMWKEGR